MSEMKKRIAIIEDHPMVRDHLSQIFGRESDMEVCGEAEDAEGGMALLQSAKADLAIVDLTLKNSSGLELIQQMRAFSIDTPVLVLSMHEEAVYARRALGAGASGYLAKTCVSGELVAAARQLLAGKAYFSAELTSSAFQKSAPKAGEDAFRRSTENLSKRELAVLEMIGRGLNPRTIAETLGVGLPTVDTYRARIKEKMNLANSFELQHFAIRWLNKQSEPRL